MIFKTYDTGYTKVTTLEYEPTTDELYWYYSGTSVFPNPNNPYRRGARREINNPRPNNTKVEYKKLKDNSNMENK